MPNQLPNNNRAFVFQRLRELTAIELRAAIVLIPTPVGYAGPIVKVHEYEQFPKTALEIQAVEEVPDPVVGMDDPLKSYIEIGPFVVGEDPYTSDQHTQLTITMPMTLTISHSTWPNLAGFYPDTTRLGEAVYAFCGDGLRNNRTFGYDNVAHYYLQQIYAATERDEDDDSPLGFEARWLLTVTVGGARA